MKPLAAVGLKGLVVLIAALVVSLPAPSLAGTFVAFGPQTYVRPEGAPITETRSVTVRNPNTSYTLRIHNGGLVDGAFERVSSSVITLNGVQIVGPDEFNQTVTLLEKPIAPAATNELAVQLRGQPGGGVTIEILGMDTDLPVITAAADRPPNVAGWYTADLTVSFTCSDATSGVATCPPSVVVSAEGANQVLSGTAVDLAGNTAIVSLTLSLDKTPPGVTPVVSPPSNATGWHQSDLTVSFTCSDATSGVASCPTPILVQTEGANQVVSGVAVDVAGNRASASITLNLDKTPPVVTHTLTPVPDASGWARVDTTVSFAATDALSGVASAPPPVTVTIEGATQPVTGTATDQAGNAATATVAVSLDTTPPVIIPMVSPPPNANGWHTSDVTVGFTCSDATSGVATCPPPVVVSTEGANQVVSGTAVDVAGNSASASVTLNLDTTPPTLTSTLTPAPNAAGWTRVDTIVSFAATDALSGVASVSAPVTITTEGATQLVTGTATDQAGNTATASVAVSLDRTPPVLTPVVSPPPNAAGWHNTTVTVSFAAEDALAGVASVTPPVTLTTEGPAQVVPGTAIDQAGNQATASVTVSLDTTPPVVALTSPPNLSLFGASPVAVSGTVDDPDATVLVNGVAAAGGGGTFTVPQVPLREGRTVLTAAATDQAGNVGTGSLVVTLDTTPPTVRIDTPSDRAILTTPQVTVTGMLNDLVSGTVNAEQATVTVNGVPATIVNRSFLVPELLLVRGTNTITAVARDRVGNESRTQIQVTVQAAIGQPRLERVSGQTQSGGISATLPEPLVVRLVDPEGRPLPGRPVTFTVVRPDGVVRALPEEGRVVTVPTDALGQARVLWQLGTRTGAGNHQVAVTSPGVVGEVVFCASATVAAPAQIVVVSGEPQRGLVGAPLPLPFVAMVVDAGGNPVGGVPVTFTVEQGGGTLDGTPATTVTKPTDSDGRAAVILTLGEQEGISNQVVTAGFEGVTGTKATFVASGVVPGPPQDTRVSGVVLDHADQPIPNATAKLVGTPLSAVTDAQGQFTIPGAPVGTITLIVDGRTSPRPETFPFLAFPMTTLAGQDNTLGMPIHLPPLDTGNSKLVGGDEEVVLLMTGVPGVAFTVFPHSATFPDGSTVGPLMLTQVPADKVPMPPPNGTAPRVVWTLQPAGVRFDPPIRVQLPNTDGLRPGQVIELFQFDHDLEQFVSVGAARVSEDGSVIVSDPGFGITKSGWGGAPPPPPPTMVVLNCDDGDSCTTDSSAGGRCINDPVIADVRIDQPPNNPTPGDDSFSSNFSFLSTTRIDAAVTVSQPGNAATIRWDVAARLGQTKDEVPASRQGATFSFTPDPPPHQAYGTAGSLVRSIALSYRLTASFCANRATSTITQDQIDIVRQEYLNHGIPIPARSDFRIPQPTTHFTLAEINTTAYSVIAGDPGGLAESVRAVYNTLINDDVQVEPVGQSGLAPNAVVVSPGNVVQTIGAVLDSSPCNATIDPAACDDTIVDGHVVAGPNGIAETQAVNQATNFGLTLTSGWRNPERNEAVGGVITSIHQYGNAVDLVVGTVPGKTRAQLFCILQTAADQVPGANGFAEIGANQAPDCTDANVTHIHVQTTQ